MPGTPKTQHLFEKEQVGAVAHVSNEQPLINLSELEIIATSSGPKNPANTENLSEEKKNNPRLSILLDVTPIPQNIRYYYKPQKTKKETKNPDDENSKKQGQHPNKLEQSTEPVKLTQFANSTKELMELNNYQEEYRDLDINYESGARNNRVSPSQMPSYIAGFYRPINHDITTSYNLPSATRIPVDAHEEAHAIGIIDEGRADAYALTKTGRWVRLFGDPSTYIGLN